MKVLIVEDEHGIANAIKKGLEQELFAVDTAYDGESGWDLAAGEQYDVIVLDQMLPGMDGLELCRRLRKEKNHTPVLILTARGQLEDKVEGLNAGADDYLVKPFAFEELLARIRALVRRPKQIEGSTLMVGDLMLDTIEYSVKRGTKKISLSKKEFALLEYLMHHPKQPLAKDQIISHVWNYDANVLPNTVEVYIGYLRRKIDFKKPYLIHTVRGFGYQIGGKNV